MKTFGLIVPKGTGRVFDTHVRELLERQTSLAQIILPLLDAWHDIRKRVADLGRQLLAAARESQPCSRHWTALKKTWPLRPDPTNQFTPRFLFCNTVKMPNAQTTLTKATRLDNQDWRRNQTDSPLRMSCHHHHQRQKKNPTHHRSYRSRHRHFGHRCPCRRCSNY